MVLVASAVPKLIDITQAHRLQRRLSRYQGSDCLTAVIRQTILSSYDGSSNSSSALGTEPWSRPGRHYTNLEVWTYIVLYSPGWFEKIPRMMTWSQTLN